MRYASRGIIPPKEWEHDKFLTYRYIDQRYRSMGPVYCTVAEMLSSYGIIPP